MRYLLFSTLCFLTILTSLTGCSRSTEDQQVDAVLLKIEQVEAAYHSIPDIMDTLEGVAHKEWVVGNDADLALLRQAVTKAFTAPGMLTRVHTDLAATDRVEADMSAFILAVDAFLRAEAAVRKENNIDFNSVLEGRGQPLEPSQTNTG